MNARATLVATLTGALSALMMLAPLSGIVAGLFLPLLGHAPLFFAGLTHGPMAATLAGATGAIVSGVLTRFNPTGGAIYIAIYAAPAALLVAQALRARVDAAGEPAFASAASIANLGLAVVCAVTIMIVAFMWTTFSDPETLASITAQARALMAAMGQGVIDDRQLADAVRITLILMPGVLAGYVLIMLLLGFAIGQGLATRLRWALRPAPRMADVVAPGWAHGLFALALFGAITETLADALGMAAPAIAPMIGGALVGALAIAFAVAGMAVIHAWAESMTSPRAVLTAVYVGVFGLGTLFLAGLPIVIVGLIGFLEPWLGLRDRVRGHGRT